MMFDYEAFVKLRRDALEIVFQDVEASQQLRL